MTTKALCILAGVILALEFVSTQTTPSSTSKLVMFSFCEFCSPLDRGICCVLGSGCCTSYNPCRDNLVCPTNSTCDINNCDFGCCKLPDGTCCSAKSAAVFPVYVRVRIPNNSTDNSTTTPSGSIVDTTTGSIAATSTGSIADITTGSTAGTTTGSTAGTTTGNIGGTTSSSSTGNNVGNTIVSTGNPST